MCERKMTWDEVVEKMVEYQEERDHLQAKNTRLREALRWVNMSLCAYLDHAPANLKELAYYPEKAVSNAFRLLEDNDEED